MIPEETKKLISTKVFFGQLHRCAITFLIDSEKHLKNRVTRLHMHVEVVY